MSRGTGCRCTRRCWAVERKFGGSGLANFAVRPYPSQWQRHINVNEDWRVFVRPIRPEDEPLIHGFVRHVTSQDLRLRFFAPMKEFSHEFIARLTQLDYARAMAFVAFDESTDELIGVVRVHSDSIYETGEYAILLRSDLKGTGPWLGIDAVDYRVRQIRGIENNHGGRAAGKFGHACHVPPTRI